MGFESCDSQSACVVEEPSAFLFDPSVTARRRRRVFKKIPFSSSSSRVLNLTHQGVLKRSGARPVRCSSLHWFDGVLKETDDYDFPDFLAKLSDEQGLSKIVRKGLARSRSFPPEGWKTSKYILQISRMGRPSLDSGVHSSGTAVKGKSSPVADTLSGSCVTDGEDEGHKAVGFSSSLSTQGDSCVDQASAPNDMSIDSSPHCGSDVVERVVVHQQAGCNVTSKAVADGLCPAGKTARLRSVEGCPLIPPLQVSVEESLLAPLAQTYLEVKRVNDRDSIPSGKVLICGRRREMEDMAVIVPSFVQVPQSKAMDGQMIDFQFHGVYDGHGGAQASNYCAQRLHRALAEEISSCSMTGDNSNGMKWQSIMSSCFMKVDKEVGGVCPYGACDDVDSSAGCCVGSIAPENAGTTAVVAVISSTQIILANCGDSRAVLSRGGKAVPLSKDHKPERADETSRIEAAGGRVVAWKGYRVGALLALSRAIGDRYLKRYVISEPDVVCLQRTEEDECLILASDGLWDVFDNETACKVARRCLASSRDKGENRVTSHGNDYASALAASALVKLAYGKGSQDNITVVVIDLSRRRK